MPPREDVLRPCVHRNAMLARALLSILLCLTAPAQTTLLDRVVAHAEAQGRPLLVPDAIAADLHAVRPQEVPEGGGGRGHLDAWLAQRDVTLTHTAGGGLVLYRAQELVDGVTWAEVLLEHEAPLVDLRDLVLRHSDLVWTIAPSEGLPPIEVRGLVELAFPSGRLLGGRADHVLRRLGRAAVPVESSAMVAAEGAPRTLARAVRPRSLFHSVPSLSGAIVTFDDATEERLERARLYAFGPASELLHAVAVRYEVMGEGGLRVVQLFHPSRHRVQDRWYPVELEHLDPQRAAERILGGPARIGVRLVDGEGLHLTGDVRSVRRWLSILALLDVPPGDEKSAEVQGPRRFGDVGGGVATCDR